LIQAWDFSVRLGFLVAAEFDNQSKEVNGAMPGSGSGLIDDQWMVRRGSLFRAGLLSGTLAVAFGITGAGYAANGIFAGARR
jgi:hypothetical protein